MSHGYIHTYAGFQKLLCVKTRKQANSSFIHGILNDAISTACYIASV